MFNGIGTCTSSLALEKGTKLGKIEDAYAGRAGRKSPTRYVEANFGGL